MQLTENQEETRRTSIENNEKKNHKYKRFLSECAVYVYSTHYPYACVLLQPAAYVVSVGCGSHLNGIFTMKLNEEDEERQKTKPNKEFSLLLRPFE